MRQLGPIRLASMVLVAVGLIAFLMFAAARFTTPSFGLLFADLPLGDSAEIVNRLEAMNVPYELRGDGSQVLVPMDQVARLRMTLAADGLPNGGSVGYEVFDQSDGFGTSAFVQRLNRARALEGELSRTIAALTQVQTARVHLVLPQRELFSREDQEPSASVILKLRGGELQTSQVRAIQHLVAAAVPKLSPGQVSIVDTRGTLLARGGGDEVEAALLNADENRRRYEQRLARTIEELLERSVGRGKVRAEVAAEIDFDRVTTSDEIYDPDSQVVRSTQTVEEADDSTESSADGGVSVDNNLPQFGPGAGAGPLSSTRSSRTEETVNFEISRTVRTLVRETGVVRRLSVAVLVDGIYPSADSDYIPRTEQEMEQLVALVKSAIGYDEARGDVVEVVNLQFVSPNLDVEPVEPVGLFGLANQELIRMAEMLMLGILGILVMLLVVRPLIARAFDSLPTAGSGGIADKLLADHSGGAAQLGGPGGDGEGAAMPMPEVTSELDEMINVSSAEGQVRASSIKKVAEIVERNPEETATIIRSWMYQDR